MSEITLRIKAPETLDGAFELLQPGQDARPAVVKCVFRCKPLREDVQDVVRQGQLTMFLGVRGFGAGQAVVRRLAKVFPKLRARVLRYGSVFEYLDSLLVSWEGVDMPWSREACDSLTRMYPGAQIVILAAWLKAHKEARLGN
jgi:hypothetical protein